MIETKEGGRYLCRGRERGQEGRKGKEIRVGEGEEI